MPDEETKPPSLEPPRLFGRRRKPNEPSGAFEDASSEPAAKPARVPDPTPTPTRPVPVAAPAPASASAPAPVPAPEPVDAPEIASDEPAAASRSARNFSVPPLVGPAAAAVTGVVVGAGLLALVLVGFQGCEALQGTDSCGTGPGMIALVVVFALAVVLGRVLLSLFALPDPGSTSFLGVGLTSVIALLFFIDVLDTWPMFFVIPVISAASYLLSWWVTTIYVDPASD